MSSFQTTTQTRAKKMIALIALAAIQSILLPFSSTRADIPCEEMLTYVRSIMAQAKLGDSDLAKVDDLYMKALKLCSAGDINGSDRASTEAIKLIGE